MADITRVMIIILLFSLTAGEDSLSAVDDDDVVTAVNVRGKGGLVLAAEKNCGYRGTVHRWNLLPVQSRLCCK